MLSAGEFTYRASRTNRKLTVSPPCFRFLVSIRATFHTGRSFVHRGKDFVKTNHVRSLFLLFFFFFSLFFFWNCTDPNLTANVQLRSVRFNRVYLKCFIWTRFSLFIETCICINIRTPLITCRYHSWRVKAFVIRQKNTLNEVTNNENVIETWTLAPGISTNLIWVVVQVPVTLMYVRN